MIADEQLVARAQAGDTLAAHALVDRFTGFAYSIAADYYDVTGDRDDLRQEALVGLWKGIRDYRSDVGSTFKTFAGVCIRRQSMTAVKTATRAKHRMLTMATREAISVDGDVVAAVDLIAAPAHADPVQHLINREQLATVVRVVTQDLSALAREVVAGTLNGDSYAETQRRLGRPTRSLRLDGSARPKVVENAIDRARRKVLRALDEDMGAAA